MSKYVNILASAARTTLQSVDVDSAGYRGVRVFMDTTVDPASASITPSLYTVDPQTGVELLLLAGDAVAAVGDTTYTVYPGIAAEANVSANTVLGHILRVKVAVADTDSMTYQMTAEFLK